MSWAIVVATYLVIVAFYVRLGTHALRWAGAAWRAPAAPRRGAADQVRSAVGAVFDVFTLRRLFLVNPALWFGEWTFHAALTIVVLRHLRYFTEPVPAWVGWAQTPGWIAGFVLPVAVAYVLAVRLVTKREQYSAPVNLLLLADVLAIAFTGLLLATRHRVDLVNVKVFALGVLSLRPAPPPADLLLAAHLGCVLALALYVPSHVFAAPLTLLDARRRGRELHTVLHDG